MLRVSACLACLLMLVYGVSAADTLPSSKDTPSDGTPPASEGPVLPIPRQLDLDPRKVALGRELFFDPRLSRDGTMACVGCHDLARGGVDGRRYPVGARGALNTPTVFNSAAQVAFSWDGRASSLEEQINGSLTAAAEMGSDWPALLAGLGQIPRYRNAFAELYPGGLGRASILDALATFVRSLITPDSRFDKYLRGDETALDEDEKRGYELFKQYGCVSCHQGRNIGGNMFQVIGVMEAYPGHEEGDGTHLGRYNVTGRPQDRHKFRVPGLRNVALTAPYFHDGHAETLDKAVREMARYQLGRPIRDQDVDLIVRFLCTLTGEYQGAPL